MAALKERVKLRFFVGEAVPDDAVIDEVIETITDRLLLRLDTAELPQGAGSIVVDASMKALRLRGFEGSTSEAASDGGSVSNSFISDILEEYEPEIDRLYKALHKRGIKFL